MGFAASIDSFFKVSERGSSISTEIRAGVITFLTMSYILLVNPQILGSAGLEVQHVVAATALSSALASILCGVLCNFPCGMAPGMGINAFLVYSQVLGLGVSVHAALACCFTAAVLVAVLAIVRLLGAILGAVPNSIKMATVVGMGLLLSFIGLQTAKVVIADKETMVGLGDLTALEPLLALGGLAVVAALHYLNVPGSILIGIIATALGYWGLKGPWPHSFFDLPHLTFIKNDFTAVLAFDGGAWSAVIAYTLVIIFDVGGVAFGVCTLAGLLKDGTVPGATVMYLSAAAGAALGALTGTTPLIIAAETAVGIKEGGRTGLMSCVVGACFLLSMFAAPFLQSIPGVATAPVLVLVGAMMMGESKHIDWTRMNVAVPAFLTMVIQPFTFSIANGIYAGLLFSLLLFFLTGEFVPYCRQLFGAPGAETDLEADLLPPPGGPLASPGGWSDRSLGRPPSMVGALHSAGRMLSSNPPYVKTYDMLINTKGEPMPAEGEAYPPSSYGSTFMEPNHH